MSNAAAVIGLTFDTIDIQQDPFGIFLEMVSGYAEGPSVRGVDSIVPGREGRIARGRMADTWRISLKGWVAGIGADEAAQRESFAALRETLRDMFDPRDDPRVLEATLEDGTVVSIVARALPTPIWEPIPKLPTLASVSYELEALEDWQAAYS